MIAELRATVAGGRLAELSATPPLGAKVLPGRRGPTLVLIGTAASLLEGDRLRVCLRVAAGQHLAVRSAAAQVAHPCLHGGSTGLEVEVVVEADGCLDWRPEPLIVSAGARHTSSAWLDLTAGARVRWVDEVLLGRSGDNPDEVIFTSALRAGLAGRPLLRDGVDTTLPDAAGPAVLDGARYLGTAALLGTADHLHGGGGDAWAGLAGAGRLTRVLDRDPLRGRATLQRRLCCADPSQ